MYELRRGSTLRTWGIPRLERARRAIVAAVVAAGLLAVPASLAARDGGWPVTPARGGPAAPGRDAAIYFDVRGSRVTAPPPGRARAAAELRDRLGRFGRVDLDRLTATPRLVARLDGFLTGKSVAPAKAIALGYVRANSDVFGLSSAEVASLRLMRSWRTDEYAHLVFAQTVGDIPAVDNGIVANVAADGRLINVTGTPLPGIRVPSLEPRLRAAEAVRAAVAAAGVDLPVAEAGRDDGPRQTTRFAGGHSAKLSIFGDPAGSRLAWRVVVRLPSGEACEAVLDAESGEVLRRRSLTRHAVTAKVFPHFPGAAVGGSQVTADISPYISFPGSDEMFGDFAYVFTDVNQDGFPYPLSEEIRPSSGDDYLYTFTPFNVPSGNCTPYPCSWNYTTANSWTANRRQAGTQAFYFVNRFHDHLLAAPISFTPAKGNFEGFERVWIDVDAGATLSNGLPPPEFQNNSFMSTLPPGGEPGAYMQLLLFQPVAGSAFRSANSTDDPSLVYHEYTHGLSSRLVSDVDWSPLLDLHQSNALAEAWSDWYAMDRIVQQGFLADTATNGEVKLGLYLGDQHRTQGLDCAVGAGAATCPGGVAVGAGGYTYGDVGKIAGTWWPESHSDGEIFAETLWDLRRRLSADHGATEGVRRARLLVTRAMELSPGQPSFLDVRNAILLADTAFNAGADRAAIWQVFATRGMGYFAGTIDAADVRPSESFSLPPPAGGPTGTIAGMVKNEQGAVLAGAKVSVGGHDSGFSGDLTATTDASGAFSIGSVPVGTYEQVFAAAPGGYDIAVATDVVVSGGQTTTQNFTAVRDWAASAGGATVSAFTGPNYPDCGPRKLIDTTERRAWLTDSPAFASNPGPKSVTIQLPEPVSVSAFAIDPATGCGAGITASLGDFRIETSTNGVSYVVSATGTFTQADTYRLNKVNPGAGTASSARFVRLTGLSTQNMNPPFQGAELLGVTELEVYGSPAGASVCNRSGGVLTVNVTSGVMIGRSGANLTVTGDGNADPSCGGSTVNNVNTINVNGGAGAQSVTLDLAGGRLEPGLTAEASGVSEIEVNLNLSTGADTLAVKGFSAADNYRFGTTGANLNVDDDGNDVVLGGVDRLIVNGAAGNDIVSLKGALATGSPLAIPATLNGGLGADKLTGGTLNDVLNGGDGSDVCNALGIADGADVCNGGASADTAAYAGRAGAVTLTNNGVADDGATGEGDNIATDVEHLIGGMGGDMITIMLAGASTARGGAGSDTLDVRDGVGANGDTADGGSGIDACLADAGDTKVACEA